MRPDPELAYWASYSILPSELYPDKALIRVIHHDGFHLTHTNHHTLKKTTKEQFCQLSGTYITPTLLE